MKTIMCQELQPGDWTLYVTKYFPYVSLFLGHEESIDSISKFKRTYCKFIHYDPMTGRIFAQVCNQAPFLKIDDPSLVTLISNEQLFKQIKEYTEENLPEFSSLLNF